MAINAGCDLNCGNTYLHILKAYKDGLIRRRLQNQQLDYLQRDIFRVCLTRLNMTKHLMK